MPEGLHEGAKQKMEKSKTMVEPFCENCESVISEDEKYHRYEEDGIYVCDDCYQCNKHPIGRTGG